MKIQAASHAGTKIPVATATVGLVVVFAIGLSPLVLIGSATAAAYLGFVVMTPFLAMAVHGLLDAWGDWHRQARGTLMTLAGGLPLLAGLAAVAL